MQNEPILKISQADVRLIEDRKAMAQEIKKLQAQLDAIDAELRTKMESSGAHLGMHRANLLLEMRPWSRTIIDSTRLRAEQPMIAEKYAKTSSGQSLYYL